MIRSPALDWDVIDAIFSFIFLTVNGGIIFALPVGTDCFHMTLSRIHIFWYTLPTDAYEKLKTVVTLEIDHPFFMTPNKYYMVKWC